MTQPSNVTQAKPNGTDELNNSKQQGKLVRGTIRRIGGQIKGSLAQVSYLAIRSIEVSRYLWGGFEDSWAN